MKESNLKPFKISGFFEEDKQRVRVIGNLSSEFRGSYVSDFREYLDGEEVNSMGIMRGVRTVENGSRNEMFYIFYTPFRDDFTKVMKLSKVKGLRRGVLGTYLGDTLDIEPILMQEVIVAARTKKLYELAKEKIVGGRNPSNTYFVISRN
jgi:hypothetical protein